MFKGAVSAYRGKGGWWAAGGGQEDDGKGGLNADWSRGQLKLKCEEKADHVAVCSLSAESMRCIESIRLS